MIKISREGHQKLFRFSFLRRSILLAFLTALILGSASFSRGESTIQIRVTAVVLPKTPPLNYKRLHEDILRKMEEYSKQVRIGNPEKYLKATVNLDFMEGSQGIVIERMEGRP